MPELRGMRAVVQFLRQSAESGAAPSTSPFMALLMDLQAVKALACFPRCLPVCPNILEISSLTCPVSHVCNRSFNSEFSVSAFGDLGQEQSTTVAAEESPRLVPAHGSFEAFCPCRGVPSGSPAELGEYLFIPLHKSDFPAVW